MSTTKRDIPVEAIDQFDDAYSLLHVILLALEADGAGQETALLQLRETMNIAIAMLLPVRDALNKGPSIIIKQGGF